MFHVHLLRLLQMESFSNIVVTLLTENSSSHSYGFFLWKRTDAELNRRSVARSSAHRCFWTVASRGEDSEESLTYNQFTRRRRTPIFGNDAETETQALTSFKYWSSGKDSDAGWKGMWYNMTERTWVWKQPRDYCPRSFITELNRTEIGLTSFAACSWFRGLHSFRFEHPPKLLFFSCWFFLLKKVIFAT